MSEKEIKKIPFRMGYLDIIDVKIREMSNEEKEKGGWGIYITKMTVESITLPKSMRSQHQDMVAKIELISDNEPDSILEHNLTKLFFPPLKNVKKYSYPDVRIYDFKPYDIRKEFFTFKIDVVLTQMKLYGKDYLEVPITSY